MVLTPIYGIHWGLQTKKTLLAPGNSMNVRQNQTKLNSKKYKNFLKEVSQKLILNRCIFYAAIVNSNFLAGSQSENLWSIAITCESQPKSFEI